MPAAYWSPSVQEWNPTVDGSNEEANMQKLVDTVLTAWPLNIRAYRNKPEWTLKEVVRDSNRKLTKTDLHFAVHTNAGKGSGVEVYCNMKNAKGKALAEQLSKDLSEVLGIPNRGAKDGMHLYEIKCTKATTVLVEVCFHDNANDMAKLKSKWTPVAAVLRQAAVNFFIDSKVHVLEFSPKEYDFKVDFGTRHKLEPVSNIVKMRGAKAGINLGFFNLNGSAEHYGLLMKDGKIVYNAGRVMDCYLKNGKFVVTDFTDNSQVPLDADFAVGLSFSLVINGKKDIRKAELFSHAKNKEPRTAIGQKGNGNIVLVAVEAPGMTADELAEYMLFLNCQNAINADGGGSTTMVLDNKLINTPEYGKERAVGSVLLVFPKKSSWKDKVMRRLKDEGIIFGDHNPNDRVTWAELAAVIGKVLDKM